MWSAGTVALIFTEEPLQSRRYRVDTGHGIYYATEAVRGRSGPVERFVIVSGKMDTAGGVIGLRKMEEVIVSFVEK